VAKGRVLSINETFFAFHFLSFIGLLGTLHLSSSSKGLMLRLGFARSHILVSIGRLAGGYLAAGI
jgi:hypothetical protein